MLYIIYCTPFSPGVLCWKGGADYEGKVLTTQLQTRQDLKDLRALNHSILIQDILHEYKYFYTKKLYNITSSSRSDPYGRFYKPIKAENGHKNT